MGRKEKKTLEVYSAATKKSHSIIRDSVAERWKLVRKHKYNNEHLLL